ncbi:Lnb N-terminal periplasmic domain-containing protein [Geofilum rhodophaeum]|uniref:Lnb N-terminal periplasmic domain-containing protein n=1 Tax=Geofilum rhodophaeum TaxID=1965019 RepID=UPI001314269D|nr:DUF4105 domain-containing protein [Geofilum rhodophaeum]
MTILTCAPGEELYSLFGHTAIRVQDKESGSDYVFNYGTFDFSTPNFYLKFMRGELDYMLSVTTFDRFLREYQMDSRSVWEQELLLSETEKSALLEALMLNHQPENRYYPYHFFYDNCATRVRDIIAAHYSGGLEFPDLQNQEQSTFRTALSDYLEYRPWTKLGLDLILGQPTDEAVDAFSIQFLPDHLMLQFAGAHDANGKAAVGEAHELLVFETSPERMFWTPLLVFSLLALIGLRLTRWRVKRKRSLHGLNIVTFVPAILLGFLIIFLWFFTSHSVTGPNWHLLWAHPLYLLLLFPKKINLKFQRRLRWLLLAPLVFLLLLFPFLPQDMPLALWPLWLLMAVRLIW